MMPGEGLGETTEKIGNWTDKKKCINNCKEKGEKVDRKINGVMVGTDDTDKGCWCVSAMTGRGNNTKYESCMYSKYTR